MSERVDVIKKVYGKNSFPLAVDTEFKQLIPVIFPVTASSTDDSVEAFFQSYDNLFFDIPPSGSDQSHLVLITKSSEYLGISLNDLQDEIRLLREENVSLKNQLFNSSFGNTG